MKFNTKYKYDKVTGFHFNKASLTDQSQSYDADINNIVNNMALTPQQAIPPIFGSEFNPDMYQDALNLVANAKSGFEKLPAHIRREFDNDPMKLVQFMDNPNEENAKKGVMLGIFNPDILKAFEKASDVIQPTLSPSDGEKVTEPVSQ